MDTELNNLRCRICLTPSETLIALEEEVIINKSSLRDKLSVDTCYMTVLQILVNCLQFDIRSETQANIPKRICFDCVENAKVSYEFKLLYEESTKRLQNEAEIGARIKTEDSVYLDEYNDENSYDNDSDDDIIVNCSKCGVSYAKNGLKKHTCKRKQAKPQLERRIPCDICKQVFKKETTMWLHRKKHKGDAKNKCPFCEYISETPTKLGKHMTKEHNDKKTLKCGLCDKSFFMQSKLKVHMLIHTGEKKHVCEFCGVGFSLGGNLIAHRRLHLGEKPFTCGQCGKSFRQQSALKSHEIVHRSTRDHVCTICGATFSRIECLRRHDRCHTKARPYQCEMCDRTFAHSCDRKRHMATHTGVRDYACDICGQRFTRNTNLTVHRRIHTGERPHTCEVCGKGFIQAHSLRLHMNTHSKKKAIFEISPTDSKQAGI